MAGNYPNAPSWRMAWDRDGTQAYKIDASNVITQVSHANVVIMNNENIDAWPLSVGSGAQPRSSLVIMFPELRDFDGYYLSFDGIPNAAAGLKVEVSADSTNGLDGAWVGVNSVANTGGQAVPVYRQAITSATSTAIRAIKISAGKDNSAGVPELRVTALHLYGEPSPGENPNRLALWHPTLDQRVDPAYFDWGNVPRSSSADRLFRVKNLSAVQTAGQTRVAMDVLTDGTPSIPGQHSLSYGGGSFLAQVNVGDLSPGAISGPVTLRRITPSNAQLSVWAFRVFAESNNWS